MTNRNRREFIATTAATAIVAASGVAFAAQPGTPPAAAPAKPKRTLRKAVMFGMIGEGKTFAEKFKILKEAGFDGVEGDSPTDLNIAEMREAADKAGITIHGMVNSKHWGIPLNVPDPAAQGEADKALETCLRDAKKAGSTSILLVPGVVNEKLAYDDCWKLSIAAIKRALPVVKETGVRIAVENVWNNFIMSPIEASKYLDEIGDPMVGWHFDIGNVINFGWPEQWVKVLGPRVFKLHIKDFSRKKRNDLGLWKGFEVELGEGDAGWPRVMTALDVCGYSTAEKGNWATAEVGGGDTKRLKVVADQMDKLFAM